MPTRHPDPANPFDPLDGTPTDTLDLHGFRADEAAAHFELYLNRQRKRAPGALLHVITGKGRHSPNGPVLKRVIRQAIRADGETRIAAWSRDDDHGGFLIRMRGGR